MTIAMMMTTTTTTTRTYGRGGESVWEERKKIGMFGDRSIGHALMKQNDHGGGGGAMAKKACADGPNVLYTIYRYTDAAVCCGSSGGRSCIYE